MGFFFNNDLFPKYPCFPQSKYIIDNNWVGGGGGGDTHSMTIFLELLNIVRENDFLKKN